MEPSNKIENNNKDGDVNEKPASTKDLQNPIDKSKWVETKKELEKDENGNWVEKKITIELSRFRRKERIDLMIRLLALTAILMPIILFSLQQKKEQTRQNNLLKLETYTNTSKAIRTILDKDLDSEVSKEALDNLNLTLYPKIKFIDDKLVITSLDTLKEAVNFLVAVHSMNRGIDTILLPAGYDRFFTNYLLRKNVVSNLIKNLKFINKHSMVHEIKALSFKKDSDDFAEILNQLTDIDNWEKDFLKTIDSLTSKVDSIMLKSVLTSSK